ncbi:hypothetical protein ACQUFY_16795 [Robbsia andropogonis]|uniref:hypothetical protein n=1 Tax=Robbsia andropogonis TaxID=28092 RepID=UPI003D1D45A4
MIPKNIRVRQDSGDKAVNGATEGKTGKICDQDHTHSPKNGKPFVTFFVMQPDTVPASGPLLDGYPQHPESGASFMPWCAPVSPAQFRTWRGELVEMIEELAALQGWRRDHLDDVLTRAINGPVSDLRPNWRYFRDELHAIWKALGEGD